MYFNEVSRAHTLLYQIYYRLPLIDLFEYSFRIVNEIKLLVLCKIKNTAVRIWI